MERLLIFGVLSLTYAWPPLQNPLSDILDSFEDIDNPLSDVLDNIEDAVEDALNQSSIDTDNFIDDEAQDSNDCSLGYTWCDAVSKCLEVWEDCVDDTENQGTGADEDEHGCIGSAGYAWCKNLDDCVRSSELDGDWNDICEIFFDNTSISVNSSTESSLSDGNFTSTSANDSSSSSDDGYEDHIEDSDNPLSELLDSISTAVEEALNQSSIDTENSLSEALDSVEEVVEEALNQSSIDTENPLSEALDSIKEAVEEILNQSSIDTENLIDGDGDLDSVVGTDDLISQVEDLIDEALNQSATDTNNLIDDAQDSYGCVLSAGYTWCDALSKCLRVAEEDCVDDWLPTLDGDLDEHGCVGSAGYSWCEKIEDCLRPLELVGDWGELCDIFSDDAPISEDETKLDNVTSDDEYYENDDDSSKVNSCSKGCSKKFFQTRIFIAIVILTCLAASYLCWRLRRNHIRAKQAAISTLLTGNAPSKTKDGETTARKEGKSTSATEATTVRDYNVYSNVV